MFLNSLSKSATEKKGKIESYKVASQRPVFSKGGHGALGGKVCEDRKNLKAHKKYFMTNNPKISVLMPAYNAEKYIDDCSTDGTYSIIQRYAEKDNRIVVLKNKKNKNL